MKFSIIIPVRAINHFLIENINHLKNLDYEDFEVIILVDTSSTYDFDDNRFKLFDVGPKGPGEKRNIGALHASGEVLAFLDDDAYPTPNWLNIANQIFEQDDIYAAGGPAITPADAEFLEKMSGYVLASFAASASNTYRHKAKNVRLVDDYPSVNLLVRKNAFDAVGGFNIEFWPGEDTKLCLDLVHKYKKGFVYDPRLVVYHHRRVLFGPHLKQVSRYGQHRGQFARIFPETSRIPSYFVPSLFLVGLFSGPVLSLLFPQLWVLYFSILILYGILLFVESFLIALYEKSIRAFFYVFSGIFLTHMVYGANFLVGILRRPKLKLRSVDKFTGDYLHG